LTVTGTAVAVGGGVGAGGVFSIGLHAARSSDAVKIVATAARRGVCLGRCTLTLTFHSRVNRSTISPEGAQISGSTALHERDQQRVWSHEHTRSHTRSPTADDADVMATTRHTMRWRDDG
jgi:hypothetical protein